MQKQRIRKLPTLLLYHDGKVISTHSGLIGFEALEDFIADALQDNVHTEESSSARGKISMAGSEHEGDDYMLKM